MDRRNAENGAANIGRMIAQRVFSRFSARSVSTLGTIVTWKGSTISRTTQKAMASRPRNRKQESP